MSLRADEFGERGEPLQLQRVSEKARQEMEALNVAGEQIDERLAVGGVDMDCAGRA
jgi:hypothetical protein